MRYDSTYYTPRYYNTTMTNDDAAAAAAFVFLMIFFIFVLFVAIAIYVYNSIALGKIFKKAGIEFWVAWVPFYNTWKMFELGKLNGALSLLVLIPWVGAIVVGILSMVAAYRIGLGFKKPGEFVLLYIFLSPVWLGILAFGKAEWKGQKIK